MKKSLSHFLESFRRITSGGNYIPEVDGLRFVALLWVVVLMHLANIIDINLYNGQLIRSSFLKNIILEGGDGVSFFFMISGFILILPFIKEKVDGSPKVSLKRYYLRRLTRLEPPYIIALLIAFFLLVYVVKKYTFSQLVPHLLASVFYLHNIIYNDHSTVLAVAWSLEVEVQFYILAPLFSYVFFIRQVAVRRGILLVSIAAGALWTYTHYWGYAALPVCACYFFTGILLADLYSGGVKLVKNSRLCFITGCLIFFGINFIFSVQSLWLFLAKLLLMAVFFYIAITNERWKKIMRIQWISIIGGMCYSIYLLHLMIMSAMTGLLKKFPVENHLAGFIIYGIIILAAVLVISMIFYKLIEQPFMRRGRVGSGERRVGGASRE